MHSSRNNRIKSQRLLAAACTATFLSGCMTQSQTAPPLAGPSGFGVSLTMVAKPAVLPRDGISQTTVTVTARDSAGAGVPNLRLVPSVSPEGTVLTQLSQNTASDGTVTFVITAPTQSTVAAGNQVVLSIVTAESDFQNSAPRAVTVGLLGPSNATYPTPDFTVAPEAPVAGSPVVFDASLTKDEGVPCLTCTFTWTIEGTSETGSVITHVFGAQGAFPVTLTVTDITGTTRSITRAVDVAAPEAPPVSPPATP
jgi:hypothetical protein